MSNLNLELLVDALEDYRTWFTHDDADEEDHERVKEIDEEIEKIRKMAP
jgi:hypothetical protein